MDMVCYDRGRFDPQHRPHCCVYASRRHSQCVRSHEEIDAAYGRSILMYEEMPEVLSGAMGNFAYIARFPTEAIAFAEFALQKSSC